MSDGLVKLRTCSTREFYILVQYGRKILKSSYFLTGWKSGPLLLINIEIPMVIFHFWGWFLDSPKNSFYWIFSFHIAPECRTHVYYKFWALQIHRTPGSGSTNAKCWKSASAHQMLLQISTLFLEALRDFKQLPFGSSSINFLFFECFGKSVIWTFQRWSGKVRR